MVATQKDPVEPPKFKINKKIPRGPPSPPAPVMNSPTRKATVKEQKEWKIPPYISNWKNAKGYTIPLDERLAAVGRGLQQLHINDNFAKLAETLYIGAKLAETLHIGAKLAETLYIGGRKAREAVEMRAQLEKKLAQEEREKLEEHVIQVAQKALEKWASNRQLSQKALEKWASYRTQAAAAKKDEEARERGQMRYERHKVGLFRLRRRRRIRLPWTNSLTRAKRAIKRPKDDRHRRGEERDQRKRRD
jgi:SNW domain-containing protein 1